jgi:hypothetical protein
MVKEVKAMSTFTVTKKGQDISFDSAFGDVEIASYYVKENLSFNTFAMDLTSKENLSDKQVAWIHYLATEHLKKELGEEEVETPQFLPLVEKMYANVKTNSRKFHIHLPGVSISTVNRGANVGCLYVYENNNYIGKITDKGVAKGNFSEDVINLLLDANDNLLQLAKIYGHETGRCSVCHRELSDPLSIQMGIGPVCAKRLS